MHKKLLSVFLSMCMAASCTAVATTTATAATIEKTEVSADYGLADNIQDGTILHCFDWKYNDIKAELPNIAAAGFTAVQTSPVQPHDSTGTWYWAYLPLGFYIGSNEFGTKSDLQALCDEADKYGIKVVCDVVANHLSGDHSKIQDDLKDSQYWHTYGTVSNWADRYQVVNGEIGMPDLNTGHSYVQQKVSDYVKELKSVGVDGIRWDAAKHIGLPSEGDNFWPSVTGQGLYNYGEILVGPDDRSSGNEYLMTEYTDYISVTDSSYCADVRNAFAGGSVPGSNGNWSNRGVANNKLVYWAESHDTWSNGTDWGYSHGISQNNIDRAYATVASRAGASALYFSRPGSSDKESIKMGQKGSTHFTAPEVAEVNKFHNAMVGQKEYYTTGSNCAVVCREEGAVIVAGSGSNFSVSVPNGGGTTKAGTYVDQISGSTWTVTSSTISGQIGSSGIAVIYNPVKGPSASVTPGSKNYTTDTLSLTLNYSNATSGQYSIDGGAYQSFTDGQTITIGSGVAYGTTTTVSVKASDGSTTSDAKSYTYTKVDPTLTQKIYFDNSSYNWSSVYAYIYSGETLNNGEWPGQAMTKDSATGYYVIEVPAGLENGAVIFTESSTATTNRYPADMQPGLDLEGTTKLFTSGNSFVDYVPTTVPTSSVSTTPTVTVPVSSVLVGDTNQDGSVTISDVTELQLHLVKSITLTGNALTAADCNGDKAVDVTDATLIQYYCVKLFDKDGNVGTYTGGQPTTQPATTQPVTTQPATTQPVTTQPVTTQPVTTQPSGDGTTVTFTNSLSWGGTIYCYYWPTGGEGPVAWPGTAMQSAGTNDYGEAMYTFTVPAGNTNIIFTNGSSQTVDISLDGSATRFYPKSSMQGSGHEVGTW